MTTPLTAWYDDILPDLPGLTPGNAVLKFIRDAAIEFCERAKAWMVDHPPVDLTANQPTYPYAPGAGLVVIEPKKVMANGVKLDPATDDDLDALYGDAWDNGTLAAGPAQVYRVPDPLTIQIIPTPDTTIVGGLVMRVSVKPSMTATSVDDRLYNEITWRNAIVANAKWKAMLSPKKPYSNAEGAIYWKAEFDRLTGGVNARMARGLTKRPIRAATISGMDTGQSGSFNSGNAAPWNP